MKKFLSIFIVILALAACEKRDYNRGGLPEYNNHYYAAYLPNNNSLVTATRSSGILKFPVQFYSAFVRSYDAVANYAIVTTGIANPAVLGQDFVVVDKNGTTIDPVNGKYSMVFPQAKRATDTIYIKLLNSTVPGTRRMEVQILENQNDQYYVDIFSTAFRRPVDIK